jgi:hypothetical protein
MRPPLGAEPPASCVLWVEGNDDSAVVQSLCAVHRVPHLFRVEPQQGIARLLAGIAVEIRNPGLERFGVVVDANGDARARWAGVRAILTSEGYLDLPNVPEPTGLSLPGVGRLPRVGIWIMPDNRSPGALEDFAAALVPAGNALWERAGEAVDSIPEEQRRFPPARRSKAHVHTWLAWQEYPGSPMGQAIGKGDLDAQAAAALGFVTWLRRLMVDAVPDAPAEPA